jgi:hypothetical protein
LFLVCAFPLHVWALILAFRDLSWLTERTNAWDALGVLSYGLVLAFFDSLALFAVFALLGLLVPRRWTEDRRMALLSILSLVLSLWAIAGQIYFLMGVIPSAEFMRMLIDSGHPLRILYSIALALVVPSLLIPAYWIVRSERTPPAMTGLVERLSLLTMVYLFLDAAGLVYVLLRNIS